MSERMSDEQFNDPFDGQLQQFLSWEASDVAGAPTSSDVASMILARTDRRTNRRLSPQLMWIGLTALLIATLVGAAVAGALLLRMKDLRTSEIVVPTPTATPSTASQAPTPSPTPLPTLEPTPPAPLGSLNAAEDPLDNNCEPTLNEKYVVRFVNDGDGSEVLVDDDGTVLTGRRSELTFDGGWRRRRLNEAGLAQLVALVQAANLPNCQSVPTNNPE